MLLLLAWWQGALERRTLWQLAPLAVLGAGMAAMTVWMERYHVGAEGQDWTLSFVGRCLVAGRALWFYPRTLLWPRDLTFIYPRWSIDAQVWWQYLFPVAAVAALAGLYATRRRLGTGPLVAALCYAGMLAPALGVFNVYLMRYSFVADHFAYQADIALIVLGTAVGATRLCPPNTRLGFWSRVSGPWFRKNAGELVTRNPKPETRDRVGGIAGQSRPTLVQAAGKRRDFVGGVAWRFGAPDAGTAHRCTVHDLPRSADAVGGHRGKEPGVLDGPQQPGCCPGGRG